MVEVVRAEPQARRPDRLIYAITDAGREELARWLETPTAPAAGYRDDLYLKLVAAAREGAAVLAAVLRRERTALLAELHALRTAARDEDALRVLLAEGAALGVEARLRLLELAETDAASVVATAAAPRAAQRGARARAAS
jgi:DNA-binding PadR family transcriptional regulator